MDIRTYIWIEGKNFSPKTFQSQLDKSLRGTVEWRKRVRDGVVERVREHWKSPFLVAGDHEKAIKNLHDLISQLRPKLIEIKNDDIIIMAEVVSYCHRSNEVQGFYLPTETINLLSEVGASLDIDQYYHFEDTNT